MRSYFEKLGPVTTVDDVTQMEGSRAFDPKTCAPPTMTWMTLLGVVNASWLELGMPSGPRARRVDGNAMTFGP